MVTQQRGESAVTARADVPPTVDGPGPAPGRAVSAEEVAALRREVSQLRWEVAGLRDRVQHLDGELGYAMLTSGRLRGRLDREVAAREALEARLATGVPAVVELDQAPSSRRRAAARSGTRSFLTDVET